MADFEKTITNGINLFGLEYSTKWGESFGAPYTMVWGVSKWGESGYTLTIDVVKMLSSDLIITEVNKFFDQSKLVSSDFVVTEDLTAENLSTGIWDYVFSSDTTNAKGRDFPTWASSSINTASYTCQAVGATTWS